MNNKIFPAATLSAILLAAFGASTVGRAPKRAPDMSASRHANASDPRARRTKAEATTCGVGTCVDPVVQAGQLAKIEGETALHDTICGFLAEYDVPDPVQNGSRAQLVLRNNSYCKNLSAAVQPKVIVAVLPDPVHTQLALRFDESADELQSSIQDLGWIYDRAWLPWDGKEYESETSFDERMKSSVAQDNYDDTPGTILFRAKPNTRQNRPLIVLVVGDKPTDGVDATPFRKAIEIWKQLTGWEPYGNGPNDSVQPSDEATLSILGPTFTGSIPSLKELLKEAILRSGGKVEPSSDGIKPPYSCPSKDLHIYIASGTISDASAVFDLAGAFKGCNRLQVEPNSLDVDSSYELIQILRFLVRHGFRSGANSNPDHFASLTEAESGYGASGAALVDLESRLGAENRLAQAARDALNLDKQARTTIKKSADKKAVAAARKLVLSDENRERCVAVLKNLPRDLNADKLLQVLAPKHFYFPREISKLRAAYEQNSIFGFNTQGNSVRTQLHLSLSGSVTEEDTVHTFSGSQDPAALEAEMAQLAAELERQKIAIVLLSATDVLDELFVTRYLSQHAPNVAVIVTDTDGLFLRGGDSSMQNAYVIGPWPLIPGNQDWSAVPVDQRLARHDPVPPPVRIHDSAGGQGLYSAARLLVCEVDATSNDSCGAILNPVKGNLPALLRTVWIPEYQPPVATWAAGTNDLKSEPPLWLSVVGRGGFWPISLVDLDQANDGMPESAEYNLPWLTAVTYSDDGQEMPMPSVAANGIQETDPRSITLAAGMIALLLLWHGIACVRARLDRGFAWSYALSDKDHLVRRLGLQCIITLAAIPGLVLLKIPIEPDIGIRTGPYTFMNWALQIAAVLLATWPVLLLIRARPWPAAWKRRRAVLIKLLVWSAIVATFVALMNMFLWESIAPWKYNSPSERVFFFYRSGHLFCGSSPALPLLLLGGALVVYLISAFDRMVFYKDRIPALPSSDPALRCPSPLAVSRLKSLLSETWDHWRIGLLLAGIVILLVLAWGLQDAIPRSLAHGKFDIEIRVLAGAVAVLLLYDLAMAMTTWFLLRSDCLLPLSRSPLRWGFTWIKGWSWKRIWAPGARSPERVYDYLVRLSEGNLRAMTDTPLLKAFEALRNVSNGNRKYAAWANRVTTKLGLLHIKLADSATNKLSELQQLWAKDFGPITGSETPERGLSREVPLNKDFFEGPEEEIKWIASLDRVAKEEFVALLYLGYIRMVLLQVRNRILTASAMYILLLWALTSYPFLNHHCILIGLSSMMGMLATTIVWIYAQMHRDDILSRTTETQSGKLDADFFTKVLSMVGLPLLTLIASQFPEVSNLIFSWLEPGLSSIH